MAPLVRKDDLGTPRRSALDGTRSPGFRAIKAKMRNHGKDHPEITVGTWNAASGHFRARQRKLTMARIWILVAMILFFSPAIGRGEQSPVASTRSPWLRPFERRAFEVGDGSGIVRDLAERASIPRGFSPWWQTPVVNEMWPRGISYRVNVHSLVYRALKYSPYVHGISKTPLIHEFKVVEAEADFDLNTFMESKFLDASDPVGSELTTGGPTRYRDHHWTYSGGIRKRAWSGGEVEVAQQFGYQDTNSNFFVPKQQGTARLSLSYTQPFLNGRGRVYNTNLIVLAQIDVSIAWDQFSEQLQDHLLEVTRAYWDLYLGRASLLQRRRHYDRGLAILGELEGRRAIDAMESQVAVARAAVAMRSVAIAHADMTVRNAGTRLRTLVTAPELTSNSRLELIPTELPTHEYFPVSTRDAMLTALDKRPEVEDALSQIRAASVRLDVAKNQLLPILNFVMEAYVSGLEGHSEVGTAWANQFTQGEPGYSVGLQFEVPLYNRAAIARHKRRQLEIGQMVDQFKSRMEVLMAEVEVAVREVNTYHRELFGTYRALLAAESEFHYLHERWNLLPGEDQATSFLLEDLLSSQDRLVAGEFLYAKAEITYAVSLSNLSRAMGTLLEREQVSVQRISEGNLPRLELNSLPLNDSDVPRPGANQQILDGHRARRSSDASWR